MPSKKELMKRIEELEDRLLQLENMHARVIDANSWQSLGMSLVAQHLYTYNGKEARYCGRQLTADEIRDRYEHPLTKERGAWTKLVSGVTHEELAQFVLDGTPIKREQEIPKAKVTFAPIHHVGIKASMNIKTPLKGEINV